MPRTTNKPTRMTAKKALTAAPSKSITLQQATGQRHRLQPTVAGIEELDPTLRPALAGYAPVLSSEVRRQRQSRIIAYPRERLPWGGASQSSAQYRSEGSRKRGLRPTEKVNQHKIAKMVLNSVLNAKIAHTLPDATTRHQGNGVRHAAGGSVHRVHGSEHRGRRGAPGGPGRLGSSRGHLPTAAGHARAAGEAGRRAGGRLGPRGPRHRLGRAPRCQRRPAQLPPGCPPALLLRRCAQP